MNSRQRVVQERFLQDEKTVLKRLDKLYGQSLKDINQVIAQHYDSIKSLTEQLNELDPNDPMRAILQSRIRSKVYQKKYQEQLKDQVSGILNNLRTKQYTSISQYLDDCYTDGFIGAVYDLHGQDCPVITPINQQAVARAVQLESKISKGLYTKLGEDIDLLKRKITAQVSRALVTGTSFAQCAKQIADYTTIGYNKSVRIARTEGHRVQVSATMDAISDAKERGADVVKQWDATLDGSTRESHRMVDGEIREIDQKFSNGLMYPGDPAGGAGEVVNCRCALLQRAKWALDDKELQTLKDRAQHFGLDKTASFDDFKKKYLKATAEVETPAPAKGKFKPATTRQEAEEYARSLGVDADYSRFDISVANAVNETIQQTLEEFGSHALDSLKTIGKDASGKNRDGAFDFFTGNLSLSGVRGKDALFKMGEKTRKINQLYKGMDYFSANGDLHTIHHEIGHALHLSLGGSLDTASTSLDREIVSFMKSKRTRVAFEVSYYARKNDQELVAECVAQYFGGSPSEITKGIIEILKKYSKN